MADTDVALPASDRAQYTTIIDSILSTSDLNTISAKRIRKGLQDALPSADLAPQKQAITALIMERFDRVQTAAKVASTTPKPPSSGAAKRKSPAEESPAPKKKVKKDKKVEEEETDEQIAARLQKEFNEQAGARATRGGGRGKKAPLKRKVVGKKKQKSSTRVTGEDDSEVEGGSGVEKPEKEKKGGFHKPMNLSPALAAMLGETQLSRPQTVKKIWQYVKERDLQDPKDKRQIFCDEAMRAWVKGDKVHMFTMNKILVQHLKPADEVVGGGGEVGEEKVVEEESEEDGEGMFGENGGGEEQGKSEGEGRDENFL